MAAVGSLQKSVKKAGELTNTEKSTLINSAREPAVEAPIVTPTNHVKANSMVSLQRLEIKEESKEDGTAAVTSIQNSVDDTA